MTIDPALAAELAAARDDSVSGLLVRPALPLRAALAAFAIRGGLRNETEALLVVAARYFVLEADANWRGWFGEEGSVD